MWIFNILKWRKYLLDTVSETFGSGWSTMDKNYKREQKLFTQSDSRIVKYVLKRTNIIPEFINNMLEECEENIVVKKKLNIVLVPLECFYRVKEYDGFESIELLNFNEWLKIE